MTPAGNPRPAPAKAAAAATSSRGLYTLGLWLAAPLVLGRLALRARRQPEYLHHLGERFGRYAAQDPEPDPAPTARGQGKAQGQGQAPLFWLHAVSVGETQAARPVIEALRARVPDARFLLTHMTPTGRATARELFGDSVRSVYLPYDFPFAMRRFIDRFRPDAGVIMETELWPNLVSCCQRLGVPLYLVNARLSERSAARYRRFPKLTADALRGLSGILAQTRGDAQRLRDLGAPGVTVTGNVKFDALPPAQLVELGARWRAAWQGRPAWIAASTREGEEPLLIEALRAMRVPGALLVLVPRHPQRFDDVARLLDQAGLHHVRRSTPGAIEALSDRSIDVLLGDSMGEMAAYYSACDLAFVGGSLLPLGGQNLIEPCALGRPVLVGPHTFNFREVAEQAIEAGAARRVEDAAGLAAEVTRLLADPATRTAMGEAGAAFARQHRGATARTVDVLLAGRAGG
jgi:3-deoxy-D-manno-octulosonic-acid transferase